MHFTIQFFLIVLFFKSLSNLILQVIFHVNMFIFRKILLPKPKVCNLLSAVRNFVV